MNSIVAENRFQFLFEVDNFPTDFDDGLYSPSFTYLEQLWKISVYHRTDHLSVYLLPMCLKENMTINYGVRIRGNNLVRNIPSKPVELIEEKGEALGHKVIRWDELIAKFCRNGRFC